MYSAPPTRPVSIGSRRHRSGTSRNQAVRGMTTLIRLRSRQREAPDEPLELLGGARQLLGRGRDLLRRGRGLLGRRRHLLGGGRGLLRHRRDLRDVVAHARRSGGYLLRGGGDLLDARVHVVDRVADGLEGLARLLDRGRRLVGTACALLDDVDREARLLLDLLDEGGDASRGGLGLLGQLAHLVGYDREAAALLAGAGRLDGRVERQQVGLRRDGGDGLDDAADLVRRVRQAADGGRDLVGGVAHAAHRGAGLRGGGDALARDLAGLARGVGGLLGGAGRLPYRGLHPCRGVAGGGDHDDLALGAPGDGADRAGDLRHRPAGLLGVGCELLRGGADAAGAVGDLADHRAEAGARGLVGGDRGAGAVNELVDHRAGGADLVARPRADLLGAAPRRDRAVAPG